MFSNSSQVLTLACPCPVRMRSLRSTPHSSPDSQTWRVFLLLFFNYSLFPNETRFQGFFYPSNSSSRSPLFLCLSARPITTSGRKTRCVTSAICKQQTNNTKQINTILKIFLHINYAFKTSAIQRHVYIQHVQGLNSLFGA